MPATAGEWLQAAAGAAALWWLLAGCAAPEPPPRVHVWCDGREQHMPLEQYAARLDCQLILDWDLGDGPEQWEA